MFVSFILLFIISNGKKRYTITIKLNNKKNKNQKKYKNYGAEQNSTNKFKKKERKD